KELEDMKLSGPMQLNLGLLIPVKKPEKTKVVGDIIIPNANLTIPDWEFALKQLKGTIHFTEDELAATHLQGVLFGESAALTIKTEHPEKSASFINVSLKSKLSSEVLQSWLATGPLSKVVQGSTDYQAELNLISSEQPEPSQLILSSDLKGISLNLPDGL